MMGSMEIREFIPVPPEKVITILDQIVFTKECRRDLDQRLQLIKAATPSRERSLAITKIQEAIMWLGMDLKRLGNANPYPESYNPASPAIAPTADGLTL